MINYDVCRFCRHFSKGLCTNTYCYNIRGDEDRTYLHKFSEDGVLSLAIEESIGTIKFEKFESLLNQSRLSYKAIKGLLSALYEEVEELKIEIVEKIDGGVHEALINFDFSDDSRGIEIKDPSEHYCKEFY